MSTDLGGLAASAANTVVGLMLTDAWGQTKERVLALVRRFRPEQEESLANRLEASRSELENAQNAGDGEALQEVSSEWAGWLRRFLRDCPAAADDLKTLLEDNKAIDVGSGTVTITQSARASGRAHIYQAGGNQFNG
ncbi:hypothetical protein ACH4FX_05970 [Streptomyces sp. NPDC018019]|uniref:hypothetical protein n=1 Tax=Streptomyces sp. NPDC018019 TaxID=3365030 RepID=UPI0037B52806